MTIRKKRIIWIVSIATVMLLIIRLIVNHVAGVKAERHWYLEQLSLEISGRVDSITGPRNISFILTHGGPYWEREVSARAKLKYNGFLFLLRGRPEGTVDLMIDGANQFRKGDSLYLNTEEKVIRIYREGRLVSDRQLVKSVRGKPF